VAGRHISLRRPHWFFGRRIRDRPQQKVERRQGRIQQQLREFYSPLLGMRDEIRAKSEMRTKISAAANAARQKQVQIHNRFVPDDVKQRFDKIIDYNNEQLQEELVPLYRKMLISIGEPQVRAGTMMRHIFSSSLKQHRV
jgi:hypothetical protein